MRLRILGCSGGIGAGLRTTSFLVDDDILIDAGTGLGDLGLDDLRRIRHVFLTHSHLDHVACIPMLVDSLFDTIERPLIVHAQPATISALNEHLFNWTIWPDFAQLPNPDRAVLHFEAMEPGDTRDVDGRRLQMIAVRHAVPAAGYACTELATGSSFCFSGDTGPNESLWTALNLLESLDLLIVEVGMPNANQRLAELALHYTPSTLAADIVHLRHRPRLAISHLKAGSEDVTMAELEAVLDEFAPHRLQAGETFRI